MTVLTIRDKAAFERTASTPAVNREDEWVVNHWKSVRTAIAPGWQCCHSVLTSFPYNNNEKSLHFPTQAETKNAIIFSYIWPWNTTYYVRCIIKSAKSKLQIKQVYRKHHCITTCQFFLLSQCLLRLTSTFGNKSKHNPLQLSSWLQLTRKKSQW